jgi:hypothetical protein
MINCRNCNFSVAQNMRHSLMKNFCPSCGSALLGDVHISRLNIFRQKLSNQAFSEKLSSEDLFDIALFMLVEFFPPTSEPSESSDEQSEEEKLEASGESDSPSESYEDIRSQIREEMLKEQPALDSASLDEDLRVERLKRLAKESPIKQSKTVVRRVGS